MSFDSSEQAGRTLQYLYRIKQEHKHIAERLNATSAAQNVSNETLKELLARMTQVEQQSVQVADAMNESRQSCLRTCAELNKGAEETKAHAERQYLKMKVLETNDHEKDGRLKTFLGMIQDVSKRLDQQEQSTAILLKSRGKLIKRHDGQDLENQVVTLETENRGTRRELEAMRLQSEQLAVDFKNLQRELVELKQQRLLDQANKSAQSSMVPTVLVPTSQPEETQDEDATQPELESPQPTQTRKRSRPSAKPEFLTQQPQTSQPTQLLEHVYVRRSPRNHPESQPSAESCHATRLPERVTNRKRSPPEKGAREIQANTQQPTQGPTVKPLTETQAIEGQSRQGETPKQGAMSLTQHPITKNLVFRYSDTQRARALMESIFLRSNPARPLVETTNRNRSDNPTRPVTAKTARSGSAAYSASSPRKRKSSAAGNPERGERHSSSGGPDWLGANMVQGYPRLEKRRNVETRRSTQMETQKRRQTQQPDHKMDSRAVTTTSSGLLSGNDQGKPQMGQGPRAPANRRKKRFLPIYELPPLQDW